TRKGPSDPARAFSFFAPCLPALALRAIAFRYPLLGGACSGKNLSALDPRCRIHIRDGYLNVFDCPVDITQPMGCSWQVDDNIAWSNLPRQATFHADFASDRSVRI